MFKTKIVEVKNYHPVYLKDYDMYASISSFRLELRETMKRKNSAVYFGPSPVEGPKNMGCYLFGQPNSWKGVIGLVLEGDTEVNTIEVYADSRNVLDLENLQDIFRPVLDFLYERNIIDGYEFDTTIE